MTAWDCDPGLTANELNALLEQFALVDAEGIAPGEDDWIPTYNYRAAAAEGWRWKMAKASAMISSDLDGDRMSANQIFAHCEQMVRRYAAATSVTLSSNG
jgi:hypothetical protein